MKGHLNIILSNFLKVQSLIFSTDSRESRNTSFMFLCTRVQTNFTCSFLGIIFEKVMTKTDLPYSTASDLRPPGGPSPAIDDLKIIWATFDLVFVITFAKKISPGPKNILERRATRSSTICAKNHALNYFFDEIMTSWIPDDPSQKNPPYLAVLNLVSGRSIRRSRYSCRKCATIKESLSDKLSDTGTHKTCQISRSSCRVHPARK